MSKAELIEKIVDAMIDPWTDDPEDYLDATPTDMEYAKVILADIRDNEDAAELEPDERLPEEVTPALVMEAYNCLIRAKKFEARVARLAEWIADNDSVCEYVNYYLPEHDDAIDLFPVDFLADENASKLINGKGMSTLELIELGQHSPKFNPKHEYCWYDDEHNQLCSSNEPFRDGTLDAEAFARFVLLDVEAFDYMFDGVIDNEDIPDILGCTKEEYINEQF